MSVLGIDLGTSGVRAVAWGLDGAVLASASRRHRLERPAPGRVELDPVLVETEAASCVREVAGALAMQRRSAPTALAFSVLGEAVVPVDGYGHPLAPAAVSMDTRGEPFAARAAAAWGDRFTQITGQPVHGMFSGFKIAAGDSPWQAAAGFRCMGDHLTELWTGVAAIDYGQAARTGLFDVAARDWSDELLGWFAGFAPWLTRERLPLPVAAGSAIGALSPDAAARLGLPIGTVVVAGTHDQAAAYLGAGGVPGAVSVVSLGSSDCVTVGTPARPVVHGAGGFASYPVDDETWVTLAGTAAGGWALEWLAQTLGRSVPDVFGDLCEHPPPLLVLPYLAGSGTLDNDPAARGVIHGLTLETTVPELARAVVEAAGFEIAKIIAAFASAGVPVGELVVAGSGAANGPALGARAEAAGVPLRPAGADASARGAAMLAARGIGAHFAPAVADQNEAAHPDPRHAVWYAAQRADYTALFQTTREIAHRLASASASASVAHEQEIPR